MFPSTPLFINDGLLMHDYIKRSQTRRKWLMDQCHGPVVLAGPTYGPNQMYAWASCFSPVYQDSYILFLTGINQLNLRLILDPITNNQYIFLPTFDEKTVFWDGDYFSFGDKNTHDFLQQLGFTHILPVTEFDTVIGQLSNSNPWHLLIQKSGKKMRKDDHFSIKQRLSRRFGKTFKYVNISDLSWEQRLVHDTPSIACIKEGAIKTELAFKQTLQSFKFKSETELCGALIGELLKQTSYGLAFSPIIAGNKNAAILHYTNNSALFQDNSLVLLDFGLRWHSMCTDVSRTIPINGHYTDLQKCLMDIVIETQTATQNQVKAGVTFAELNTYAWDFLERQLELNFIAKGGQMNRAYKKQPHNIGHLLGIQVHDGDSNRSYRNTALPVGSIITIEPGLYGHFEYNGDESFYGIRIEDNYLVETNGAVNLTCNIPKNCQDIELILKHRN